MMKAVFKKRFDELEIKRISLPTEYDKHFGKPPRNGDAQQWATSAQNLIQAVYGEQSPHYKNFVTAFSNYAGWESQWKILEGVFLSAKEDFEGGYIFDVDLRISGEVFGDFVVLARHSLSEGYKDVAAVLACAALEDALKRFASINGLDIKDKSMGTVINAIKSSGLVEGAQKSLLDAMTNIRNKAMHADWENISAADVSSVIGYVEQFLLSKFSS